MPKFNEKVKKIMRELENMQNDNTKVYEAGKKIKRLKRPQKLLMKGKDGLTANPTEHSNIFVEYFTKIFNKNKQPIRAVPPTQME